MGNTNSINNTSADDLLKDYRQVRKQNNGVVLEDQNQQNTYFFKELTYVDRNQFQKELQKFRDLEKQEPAENQLNLIKISAQQFNNFCSNSFKIYTVYEYPSVTLQDQIKARSRQGKYFQECQLWSILQSCANGLDNVKPTFSIHPKFVFVMPDGILKVICNDLVDEEHRCIVKDYIYYAPQKITNFHQNQNDINLRKQSIFSLGMTLLHASILKPIENCYNYQRFQFFEQNLEECIKELVSHNYSEDFIEILAMMLEPNPNKRASLMQVHGLLSKAFNTETQQNIENEQEVNQSQMHRLQLNDKDHQSQNLQIKQSISKVQQNKLPSQNYIKTYSNSNISPYIPQNQYRPSDKENLFTDPKLLAMIRKDLQDISQLKKNSMVQAHQPYYGNYGSISSNIYPESYTQSYNVKNSYIYQQQTNNLQNSQQTFNHSRKASISGSSVNINKSNPISNNISKACSKQISPQKQALGETNINCTDIVNQKGFSKNHSQKQQPIYITEQFQDGRRFQGNILNGIKQGYGKLIYSDGAYYQGDFHDNKMQGRGVLYYMPERPAYDGQWLGDQFHGFGILYNQSPVPLSGSFNYHDFNLIQDYWVRYQGNFDSDNKCGEGKLFLSTGEQFHGIFQSDSINGQGMFLARNQDGKYEQIHGIWEDNVLVQILEDNN